MSPRENGRFQTGDVFVLDAPEQVPAVWGTDSDVLWASGEPLMVCGPQGVGKTTIIQQLALARAGVLEPTLLGFPLAVDDRPVLYLALDRPAQAQRSMRRMVSEADRPALRERVQTWRGPLPFNVVAEPRRLAEWVLARGVGTVFIDSAKDLAVGVADDAVGSAINLALQAIVAEGVEVVDEMRDIVDEQLLFDARRRLEAQALAGSGTSPNLRGLDNTAGVQSQAKGGDSVPLALAKGLALVIAAGFAPTAVVLHPDDWTDALAITIPAGGTLSGHLEVPVIKTASVTAGTAYAGDWRRLVIWLRSTDVFVSDSHSDFFTRNLVAVLAEIRAAIGVLAPTAFARITGL